MASAQLDSTTSRLLEGVDLIFVGVLTHSAPALDISLDLDLSDAGQDLPRQGLNRR
jgi:nicotinate-nucleotide pyrophosphorylase